MTRTTWSLTVMALALAGALGGCRGETAVETRLTEDLQNVSLAVEGMT